MNKKITNCKIIFIGTPEFGAFILIGLIKASFGPILVITAPDKPVGRKQILTPPPVKVISLQHRIPVIQPLKIGGKIKEIKNLKPDLIISAAWGQIIPKEILEIPKHGCLNVHPSLLPKYRGPSPIQTTILNGDKETGVTIILMDEKMDHGEIVSSIKHQVSNNINYIELEEKLAKLGIRLLIETIPKWVNSEIKPRVQDESKATYTKIIKKEDGKIDWSKSAEEIERQTRAYYSWPGTFTFWQKSDNKILQIKILETKEAKLLDTEHQPIGKTFLTKENKLAVRCGKNCLIIEELQLEGKQSMNIKEFLRGHQGFINTTLK